MAYLWARTVRCKNCRATIPLLKTTWVCKTETKRIRLLIEALADRTGVNFSLEYNVPERGGNAAQKRENDKKVGAGTMSRAGAQCPCCSAIMEMEDIRYEGKNGRLGQMMTTVVVDGLHGKEYRLPTKLELETSTIGEEAVTNAFADVPFGIPDEPTPKCGPGTSRAFSVDQYGFTAWRDLFTHRQLVALARLTAATRAVSKNGCPSEIVPFLACGISRLLDFANTGVQWKLDADTLNHYLVRFALPIVWDFAEGNILSASAGAYSLCQDRIATALDTLGEWKIQAAAPTIIRRDATKVSTEKYDVIVTDPPYYDAIPYSDLMDFFYVWLRRTCTVTAKNLMRYLLTGYHPNGITNLKTVN